MPQYFAIIGSNDHPLYETEFHKDNQDIPQSLKELNPFILHASLDIIEDLQWQLQPNNRSMFFGQDDSYNNDGVGMSIFRNSLGTGSDSNGISSLTAGFLRSGSTTNSYSNKNSSNDKNSTGGMNNIMSSSSSSNSNIQQILKNDNCYLSRVDHFYGHVITAYITYSGLKFVMVHCNTNGMVKDNTTNSVEKENSIANTDNSNGDDFIFMGNGLTVIDDNKCKKFYQEVHELYVKTLLNPFYRLGQPLNDPEFSIRVHSIAKKYI